MNEDLDGVIRQILQNYRHLMTESERRADRAFIFQARLQAEAAPSTTPAMTAAMEQALADPVAAEFLRRGRARFLQDVARRIIAEHGQSLPRCARCGGVLKAPTKHCFTCD